MSASAKKLDKDKSIVVRYTDIENIECPFREFRDNELSPDYWGMNASALRVAMCNKMVKQSAEHLWVDEQTQPLPRSVRHYLHSWVRAEELASSRWEAETVVFEDNGSGKISVMDMQLSHTQVLQRSSFCRRVLSACYILERLDTVIVEHQWENFSAVLPEGWRARYHIYSPGIKSGGGMQHRPTLSKNGCYLVRLYYLGAWRCVWVSDQVPVDAMGAPLLPFSPLMNPVASKTGLHGKPQQAAVVTSPVVHLWPLLLCKALLKLAAPDMNSDEEMESIEDEQMLDFKLLHSLTGAMEVNVWPIAPDDLWEKLVAEVPMFTWDEEDDTMKSKNVKKPTAKESTLVKRGSLAALAINDTKELPPYTLPGITPGHEMELYVSMVRDLPLKKPLPEPELPLWKYYRWVDWARAHGLYEAYDCPRTRFLKMTGFMKMSYAPHLLDVQSTESITMEFRKAQTQDKPPEKKGPPVKELPTNNMTALQKEELREWALFDNVVGVVNHLTFLYFPSMYDFTTAGNAPPVKITKIPMNRALDVVAPNSSPLYLQIDSADANNLKISLNMLHPRVQMNCGIPVLDHIESAYLILECFEWFVDTELPRAKAYLSTRGYDTVEVNFLPGRHYCRLWVHSRMNWHVALLSESSLLLGYRDLIQGASVRECPWAVRFLSNLGSAFSNMLRVTKSTTNLNTDTDFYKSYQPDLTWDQEVVGYEKHLLHWMFRQALQSLLIRRLNPTEYREACAILRRYLLAPEFGLRYMQPDTKSYRNIIITDPCDCVMSETEVTDESQPSEDMQVTEEPPCEISQAIQCQLLLPPADQVGSQICELASAELPCAVLKEERERLVRQHEAATVLQAHWRGTRARKYLSGKVNVTPEVYKCLMDTAFGNPEALSALMNEFFIMYPGAKSAYSVASALTGTTGLKQYSGTVANSSQSKWIPYFQGIFYCHDPVKVNFGLHGTLQFHTIVVYDNDTGLILPQAFRANITYDIKPNICGYTVMGHGSVPKPLDTSPVSEAHWQLTVLTSIADVFHVCDNSGVAGELCREMPLAAATKLHIDEVYIPNRRNILGGIKLFVTQQEAISFRVAASSPELELVAVLRTESEQGVEVLGQCAGKGELFWPYIKLEPAEGRMQNTKSWMSSRSPVNMSTSAVMKKPKAAKEIKTKQSFQAKVYTIEVTCPDGWPLTLDQWKRVEELRNLEFVKAKPAEKKPPPGKIPSAREKPSPMVISRVKPQPGDAYAELECSLALGGGTTVMRDDERELQLEAARRLWDASEPGRNHRGAQIRKEFRDEFLEAPPAPPVKSEPSIPQDIMGEYEGEDAGEAKKVTEELAEPVRPSPATDESGLLEMSVESEEEAKYLNLPEPLKDKFIPLPFISLCLKEAFEEDRVVITPEMYEAANSERSLRFDVAMKRMEALQEYNMLHVLGQQKKRCRLLEKLLVDGSWTPELHEVLEQRDEAIAQETLARTVAATKKKLDQKK